MKRKIITIDEKKCTGCGLCIQGCPEGALQVIDGKARLIGELLCDGLGACIGTCPEGAILIEEREAQPYDERKVMENIVKQGENVLLAHLNHLRDHGQMPYLQTAMEYLKEKGFAPPKSFMPQEQGCPGLSKNNSESGQGCLGMAIKDFRKKSAVTGEGAASSPEMPSELQQWPIQLHLLNPMAPYFKDADLVVAADCVPFAFANFHQRFLKGKALIIFCPKLDQAHELYVEKMAAIFQHNDIKSITILHMEVPCCFGTGKLVEGALKRSGKNIVIRDYTISLDGRII